VQPARRVQKRRRQVLPMALFQALTAEEAVAAVAAEQGVAAAGRGTPPKSQRTGATTDANHDRT
jgi:hypothetical protein